MKILLVIDQFDSGNNGTTISARRFAEGLQKRGHDVCVVSTGEPAENKYVVKQLPLPIIVSQIVKSQGMTFAIPNKKILTEAISEADIVHFYTPFGLSVHALKIAKELNIPHTGAFHVQPENITYTIGLGTNTMVNNKIYDFYREKFYNKISHIHCPSDFIANELKKHGYTSTLHVISNGVSDDFHYLKLNKTEDLKNKFVITMIGRLSNEKRQDLIIDAISQSKYEDKIQLFLAGNGPKRKKYIELGQKLTNSPIIKFYDKANLLQLLGMTDLYIHSADAEIEAISCIEAFSCGIVPIIANSEKSATPQFALNEKSLFEAGNSTDLANRIDYWIEHEEERKEMELKYSKASEQYHIDKCMEKIEGMFEYAIREQR